MFVCSWFVYVYGIRLGLFSLVVGARRDAGGGAHGGAGGTG